jgi:hypothetical protein
MHFPLAPLVVAAVAPARCAAKAALDDVVGNVCQSV